MRATVRDLRRAPTRALASVIGIALASAAMGVLGVSGVAEGSLRDLADDERLAHLSIQTTPFDQSGVLVDLDGAEAVEFRTTGTALFGVVGDGENVGQNLVTVTSFEPSDRIGRVRLTAGRQPRGPEEILVSDGVASPGDTITIDGAGPLTVVGVGSTLDFGGNGVIFAAPETARAALSVDGVNNVVVRLAHPSRDALTAVVDLARAELGRQGVTFMSFPTMRVNGAHPIEDDLVQISFLIASLGVVSAVVALILLASTANAIVMERSHDAAVLRALGGTGRAVRRDLRRPVLLIGLLGTALGIPFGVVVANVVARRVLERFAGITPEIGFSLPVVIGTAIFGLGGARLVSARAARRVTRRPLGATLRHTEGVAIGARRWDRLLMGRGRGGLLQRMSLRAIARRPTSALAAAAQFSAAVGTIVLITNLAASISAFHEVEYQRYLWQSATSPVDRIRPFPLNAPGRQGTETGIQSFGSVGEWEVELIGVDVDTAMFDTDVTAGAWLPATVPAPGPAPVVVAERFASQIDADVGDDIVVETAAGPASYEIVGLHPVRSVAVFVQADQLSADLGTAGLGNVIWSAPEAPLPTPSDIATSTVTMADLTAEQATARRAIMVVFGGIGALVVAIAGLATVSSIVMSLHERRVELATLRAVGARRFEIGATIGLELARLATAGWVVGVAAGTLGAMAIMKAFETIVATELGFAMAWSSIPSTAAASALGVALAAAIVGLGARRATIATTLRAAT